MTGALCRFVALGVLLPSLPACNDSKPTADPATSHAAWFREEATERGLSFRHASGHAGRHLFPEIVGGGAALFDMDDDGDLDVYLVDSGNLDPTRRSSSNRLFENDGTGRFRDVTEASGTGDRGYGMGATVGDYDNDGDADLYVTNFGPNVLYRNEGDGRFVDVSRTAGVADAGWGTSATFLDHDADGDLDLFVVNYVDWSIEAELECHDPRWLPDYCLPTNYDAPAVDRLFRNEGDGRFSDVTLEAGFDTGPGNGMGVVTGDFDGDGRVDIFVANDATMNRLWLNDGRGGFRDDALLRGCALDEQGVAKAGMGVLAEDLDDDADLDLLVVNLQHQTDSFFRNDKGYFVDATGSAGLSVTTRRFTRFGVGAADFDNDGWPDLYQANGRVMKSPEPPADDVYAEPNLLLRGTGPARFAEVSPRGGTHETLIATSRAAAFGDLDDDGGVDVVVVNRDGPAHLLRNVVPDRGHWIRFRVLEESGRDAIGATLRLSIGDRRILRQVQPAYSYQASNDPRVHVGLGEARSVDRVSVRWADGVTDDFGDFEADRQVVLRRGR